MKKKNLITKIQYIMVDGTGGKKIRLVGKENDKELYNAIINDNEYTDITIEAHNEIDQ